MQKGQDKLRLTARRHVEGFSLLVYVGSLAACFGGRDLSIELRVDQDNVSAGACGLQDWNCSMKFGFPFQVHVWPTQTSAGE
jgi:hypothetical protein